MALELVIGPANSAKAGEVLGAYAAVAPRGAVLVVPTSVDADHYRRELAASGVVFGSVLTFAGLARQIAGRTGYVAATVSELQRDRILRAVVARLPLAALAESSRAPGFHVAAGELIAELQRALITPQRFVAALRSWAVEDERRAPYAEDLGAIYLEYARELDRRGRVDRELYAWRALDSLRAAPSAWGRAEVFFYGFDELTPLQRDAVETLSRVAGVDVTVSLTYEPGRPGLQARAEAVQELTPLAERVRELPALDEHYAPASRAALHHLERGLFDAGAERVDPGDAVALLEGGGERAEAELIAGEVLALLREGVRGSEIAVVARSLPGAGAVIESVFGQYGIAVRRAREVALSHTPLGRALRGAVRAALVDEARPEDLLDFLRAPGLLPRPEVADLVEARIRRNGVRTVAKAREYVRRELDSIEAPALDALDALAAATDPAREVCRLGRCLFAAPHRGVAPLLSDAAALDAAALAALTRAVDELEQLGLAPAGLELAALLDELVIAPRGRGGEDEILLAEPLEIRARRFRAVFVYGLQEGAFPMPARPEPFLSDERRHELALCSGLRLRPSDETLDRERYLLYTTLSRATERVYLSYRSSDEEGNVALPSPFIADVAELFVADWPQRRRRRLLADVVWEPAEAPTDRELARALAAACAPAAGDEPERDRRLGDPALERLRHVEILSAGALESYADCPVKWLVERELRPQALEPESEAIVRGSVMHDVLERVFSQLGEPLTPDSLARAGEILDGVLAGLGGVHGSPVALGVGRPEIVRAGALRAIEADLRRYLEHEARTGAGWRPYALELRFGFDDASDSLPALALGDGDGRVLVRGMIDRVDADDAGRAVVRDYKSGAGRSGHPAARWIADRQLQVALYVLVVRELTELDPIGGFYQPLRGDDLRARGMFVKDAQPGGCTVVKDARERDEFEAALDEAGARAVTLAAALRSGAVTPSPQTCSRDGCAYPGICRSQ
jgi:ATP-dependent helicase/DNAse subunit B